MSSLDITNDFLNANVDYDTPIRPECSRLVYFVAELRVESQKIDDSPSKQKHVVDKLCTNLNPAFLKMANFLHRNSKHKLEREREREREREE